MSLAALPDDFSSACTAEEISRRRQRVARFAAHSAASRAETLIECQRILAQPIRNFAGLRAALAARRRLLGIRQLEADELSGLPTGYVGKLEAGVKNVGPLSFECLLGALKAELYLVPQVDEHAT